MPTSDLKTDTAANAADAQMVRAKDSFSKAALACLRGALDAPAMVQRALCEVEAARLALSHVHDAELDAEAATAQRRAKAATRARWDAEADALMGRSDNGRSSR